jgi:hypothetical protein
MDENVERDIRRAQIGKKDESLVNPYPKKEKSTSSFLMPPQNVNYHKYKRLNSPYHSTTRSDDSTGSKPGWWIVGLLVAVGIGTKIMGMW